MCVHACALKLENDAGYVLYHIVGLIGAGCVPLCRDCLRVYVCVFIGKVEM